MEVDRSAVVAVQSAWRGFLGRKESARLQLANERDRLRLKNSKQKNSRGYPALVSHNDDEGDVRVYKAVKRSTAPIISNSAAQASYMVRDSLNRFSNPMADSLNNWHDSANVMDSLEAVASNKHCQDSPNLQRSDEFDQFRVPAKFEKQAPVILPSTVNDLLLASPNRGSPQKPIVESRQLSALEFAKQQYEQNVRRNLPIPANQPKNSPLKAQQSDNFAVDIPGKVVISEKYRKLFEEPDEQDLHGDEVAEEEQEDFDFERYERQLQDVKRRQRQEFGEEDDDEVTAVAAKKVSKPPLRVSGQQQQHSKLRDRIDAARQQQDARYDDDDGQQEETFRSVPYSPPRQPRASNVRSAPTLPVSARYRGTPPSGNELDDGDLLADSLEQAIPFAGHGQKLQPPLEQKPSQQRTKIPVRAERPPASVQPAMQVPQASKIEAPLRKPASDSRREAQQQQQQQQSPREAPAKNYRAVVDPTQFARPQPQAGNVVAPRQLSAPLSIIAEPRQQVDARQGNPPAVRAPAAVAQAPQGPPVLPYQQQMQKQQQIQQAQSNGQVHAAPNLQQGVPPLPAQQQQRQAGQPPQQRSDPPPMRPSQPLPAALPQQPQAPQQPQRKNVSKQQQLLRISEEDERKLLAEIDQINKLQRLRDQEIHQLERELGIQHVSHSPGKPKAGAVGAAAGNNDDNRGGAAVQRRREKEVDPMKEREKLAFKAGAKDFKPQKSPPRPPQVAPKKAPAPPPPRPVQQAWNEESEAAPPAIVKQSQGNGYAPQQGMGGGGGYLQQFQNKAQPKRRNAGGHSPSDNNSYDVRSEGPLPSNPKARVVARAQEDAVSLPALLSARHDPAINGAYQHPLDPRHRRATGLPAGNRNMSAPSRLRDDEEEDELNGGGGGYAEQLKLPPAGKGAAMQPPPLPLLRNKR